jgi:hypothetical protein
MLRTVSVLALVSGLAIATGPPVFAQGIPMGTMKTTKDLADQKKADQEALDKQALDRGPNLAQAPALERVTPTYHDTVEDRLMREKTDDGAHDGDDVKR